MDRPSAKRRKLSPLQTEPQDGPRSTPRRASFMSPTKASLARFNPNLLSQKRDTSPSRSRSASRNGRLSRGQDLRNYVLSTAPDTNGESPIAQASERKTQGVATESTNIADSSEHNGSQNGQQKTAVGLSRPHPLAPSIRANVQPNAEPAGDEADLPATPQGLEDIEYDPPPRGILFSSPSKRGRRGKSNAQKLKSSPLKPVAQPLPTPDKDISRPESPTRKRLPTSQQVDVVQLANPLPQSPQTAMTPGNTNDELRPKIRKRDNLKDELKHLAEEIEEFERTIYALDNSDSENGNKDLDLERLMHLIGSEDSFANDPSAKPLPMSQALLSFGAFSSFTKAAPSPPPEAEEDIPSHQPIKLDDPLPHLRVFTPFTLSSQIATPPSDATNPTSLLQIHTIQIHGPQQLFRANIQMTVDTQHERISDLSISSLPAWTEAELGAWIRTPSKRGGPTKNDVSSMCWAMGSYWDLAVKRARCWIRCRDAFSSLLPDLQSGNTHAGTGDAAAAAAAVEDDNEDESEAGLGGEEQPDVRRLRRCLGRRSLTLQKEGVLLEVRWVISFDWTGEAESEVSVDYGCPRSWHEADDRRSLKKIPETFQSLVKSRGVFEAVRVMVGLLFSE